MRPKHGGNLIFDPISKSYQVKSNTIENQKERKKKGIIYVRVSTEEQKRKGAGIENQIIDCERRAKYEGVEVVATYKDEAVTGTTLKRKGFLKAISHIEKANKNDVKIDYFICVATSRFSRSSKINESFEMVSRVEITGAKLVAVGNGGIQETESEEGLMGLTFNFLVDALESKRGKKRVRAGQRGKIYSGLRPFPDVPLGYKRVVTKEGGKEIKMLIRDDEKADILTEGLNMFAEGIILTKQQLHKFFVERGLKSNSKKNKSGKLHMSIIDHLLDKRKLLIYTGNLTYPKWGINEIIPARHPALIDAGTMHKILKRLENDYGVIGQKTKKYDHDADRYPLKRILLCPECDRGVTKRKSKSHTGKYHFYYGCNSKGCKLFKKGLPRDIVHDAVRQRLEAIKPPIQALKLFEVIFKEERKTLEKDSSKINNLKKRKIQLIEKEMDRIERGIDTLSETENPNTKLIEKKQNKRSELQEEKDDLELKIQDNNYNKEEMKKILDEAKVIISNPASLRDIEDVEIKQLLIRVCFNNKIYYKKNLGLHTPDISIIYGALSDLNTTNNGNVEMTGLEPVSEREDTSRLHTIVIR